MTVIYVDVRHQEMLERPLLGGKLSTKEALSNYVRARWPTGTAKAVARAWDLSLDEARGIVAARASQSTIDKVLEPERGGWPVGLSILAGVIGYGVGQFFAAEAARARDDARQRQEDAERLAAAELAARTAIVDLFAGAGPDLAGRPDPVGSDQPLRHRRRGA